MLDAAGEVVEVERVPLAKPQRASATTTRARARTASGSAPGASRPRPAPRSAASCPSASAATASKRRSRDTRSAAVVVDSIQDADAVMTLRPYYRRRSGPLRDAELRGVPVYVLRNNTVGQIEQSLLSLRARARELDPHDRGAAGGGGGDRRGLVRGQAGRSSWRRRMPTSAVCSTSWRAATASRRSSRGREPFRRVMLVAADDGPVHEDAWSEDLRA